MQGHLSDVEKVKFLEVLPRKVEKCQLPTLAFNVSLTQKEDLLSDCEVVAKQYTDIQSLKNLSITSWLKDRNPVVLAFLEGITGSKIDDMTESETANIHRLCQTLESLYQMRHSRLVAPFSFLMTLLVYNQTSSRSAIDTISSCIPGGGYTTIQNWIKTMPVSPPKCPKGIVMNTFDNEQVVVYKKGLKPGNTASSSVITSKIFVSLDSQSDLQNNAKMKPRNWFTINHFDEYMSQVQKQKKLTSESCQQQRQKFLENVEEMRDQSGQFVEALEDAHTVQLDMFLSMAMDHVYGKQKLFHGSWQDNIDEDIHRSSRNEDIMICDGCGAENSKNKRKCDDCGSKEGMTNARKKRKIATNEPNVTQEENFIIKEIELKNSTCSKEHDEHEGADEYMPKGYQERFKHVKSGHKGKSEVIVGEPVFQNPNSTEAVATVLRHIGKENGIKRYHGKSRVWTFVCCDGRPHSLFQNIKENALVCRACGCKCPTPTEYQKHHMEKHPGMSQLAFKEFDWIYLRIGAGHLEMNVIRAFFELNWVPFLKKMCEILGFKTERAQAFAKTCKDHHLAWQLLLIFHTAATRELVLPYVRACIRMNETPSTSGYMQYFKTNQAANPNHSYLHTQVFRFSQAIINLRMAIRKNNATLAHSAKFHTKELFWGRVHPHYRNIELFDTIQYMNMPNEVKLVWDAHTSITVTGNESTGQDFDFILEEVNRQVKKYLPTGSLPSDNMWWRVCCELNVLEELNENTSVLLNINPKGYTSHKKINIDQAIRAYQPVLRGYLSSSTEKHVSIDKEELDSNLVNFVSLATEKRIHYINATVLKATKLQSKISQPVFVTPAEEQHYLDPQRQTMEDLCQIILEKLDKLPDDILAHHYQEKFNELLKTKYKKYEILNFFHEIQDVSLMGPSVQCSSL